MEERNIHFIHFYYLIVQEAIERLGNRITRHLGAASELPIAARIQCLHEHSALGEVPLLHLSK